MIKEKIATPKGSYLIDKLAEQYKHESLDKTDGLKIKRNNEWALIRASGTEPLVRIMVDSPDAAAGRAFYQEIKKTVDQLLKTSA